MTLLLSASGSCPQIKSGPSCGPHCMPSTKSITALPLKFKTWQMLTHLTHSLLHHCQVMKRKSTKTHDTMQYLLTFMKPRRMETGMCLKLHDMHHTHMAMQS